MHRGRSVERVGFQHLLPYDLLKALPQPDTPCGLAAGRQTSCRPSMDMFFTHVRQRRSTRDASPARSEPLPSRPSAPGTLLSPFDTPLTFNNLSLSVLAASRSRMASSAASRRCAELRSWLSVFTTSASEPMIRRQIVHAAQKSSGEVSCVGTYRVSR